MLPLRYAATLGLVVITVSAWLMFEGTGRNLPRFYQRLSVTSEKYALYGYAVAFRLRAAEQGARLRAGRGAQNDAAARVAAEFCADQLAHAARLLAAHNDDAEALSLLSRALRLAPWRADVRVKLLEAQIRAGDSLAPRQVSDLAYREDDPEAQRLLAKLYLRSGRTNDAIRLLRHAAKQMPKHFAIRLALTRCLLATEARDEALEHARATEALADELHERLGVSELLRAAGADTPARTDILWAHCREQYTVTALVALAYLLLLFTPLLTRALKPNPDDER